MRENSKWKFEAEEDDDAMTWYISSSYSAAASAAATDDNTINVGSSSRVFVMLCPALFTGNVIQCPSAPGKICMALSGQPVQSNKDRDGGGGSTAW